jgi:hypothetical protein
MVKSFLKNSVVDLMLFVRSKQLTEKLSFTIRNSTISEEITPHYLNVPVTLFSDLTQVLLILLDLITCSIRIVPIANRKLTLGLDNQVKKIWVGSAVVVRFFALV